MPRKGLIGGNPPQVIHIVDGGAGVQLQKLANAASEAASAAAETATEIVQDPLSSMLSVLNSNPYLIGVFYLFLNLGGRYLSMELTKRQEWFLSQPYLRPFILFAVMFISTRNIAVAFWTTISILLVLWVFANENSDFCLIPGWKEKIPDSSYEENMKKIKKSDVPDDGNHEVPHSTNTDTDKDKDPKSNVEEQQSKPVENVKDDHINNIKDDPVGHENIKESYANYE